MLEPLLKPARLLLGVALVLSGPPAWAGNPGFLSDRELADLIWRYNPDLQQARLAEAQAEAEVLRSKQLANPTLGLSLGGVPLSDRVVNYPNDSSNPPLPFGYGPQYGVEISQPLEWGKRSLRQEQARLSREGVRLATRMLHQERTADLMQVLLRLASAQLRVDLMRQQQASVEELLRITRLSAREGFVPPLDAERLEIELGRLQVLLESALLDVDEARVAWSRLTLQAAPQLSASEAEGLLARMNQLPSAWPDTEALSQHLQQRQYALEQRQGETALKLADRQRLPDVSLGLGYAYSTHPGDAVHGLMSTLSVDLPVFQAGQAERLEAESRLSAARIGEQHWKDRLKREEEALRQRAIRLQQMLTRLQATPLNSARLTVTRLERALSARGLPLSEVIHARRSVLEMESERLDLREQLGSALLDYRRLLAWNLPEPQGESQ